MNPIPIWSGGSTPAACRRAVEYCDGWLPARITLATFGKCTEYLRGLSRRAGREMITTGVMPLTSIARDREAALARVNVRGIDEANRNPTWARPASGLFSRPDDIRGLVLDGTPQDVVRETRAYAEAGAGHIVYDLRFRYADWHEQVDLLGREVLPALRGRSPI